MNVENNNNNGNNVFLIAPMKFPVLKDTDRRDSD